MQMSNAHIVWDWNGTLLDDTLAALQTLNDMLLSRSLPELTIEYYKDNFAFPSKRFYKLIGMHIEDSNWDEVSLEYHNIYSTKAKALNSEALEAVNLAKEMSFEQSLLSALRQDLLLSDLDRYGLGKCFKYVYGTDNLYGSSKVDRAKSLISDFGDNAKIVLIGDAIHDKEVADSIGAKCILCSTGSHSHHRLEAISPTARSLTEAVMMASEILRKE